MPQHLPGMAHLPGHEFSDDFNAWCAGKGGGSEHQPDKTVAQKRGKFHESSNLFKSFSNADSIDYRFQRDKSLELHQQRLTTTCWAPFASLIWMRLASCIQQCFKRRILPWIAVQTMAIINCTCAISRLDLSLVHFLSRPGILRVLRLTQRCRTLGVGNCCYSFYWHPDAGGTAMKFDCMHCFPFMLLIDTNKNALTGVEDV